MTTCLKMKTKDKKYTLQHPVILTKVFSHRDDVSGNVISHQEKRILSVGVQVEEGVVVHLVRPQKQSPKGGNILCVYRQMLKN